MEHAWKWIVGFLIMILLATRYSEGNWLKALRATFVSPFILTPLFLAVLYSSKAIGTAISKGIFSGNLTSQTIADFSLAGAIAVTTTLFVTYCLRNRNQSNFQISQLFAKLPPSH